MGHRNFVSATGTLTAAFLTDHQLSANHVVKYHDAKDHNKKKVSE